MGKRRRSEMAGPLQQGETIWHDSGGDPWSVWVTWAEVDGRAEPVGLSVASYFQPAGDKLHPLDGRTLRPVRTSVLRGGLLAAIEADRAAAAQGARSLAMANQVLGESDDDARRRVKLFTAGRVRKLADAGGAPLEPADALAEVAAIYTAAWRARRSPTKAVAEELSLSRSAAAKRVRRARDAGLLPPTTRGRASGGGE